MNEMISLRVDRDSVSMGDDMHSHVRTVEVENGTMLSALLTRTAPDIHVAGWAWVGMVNGRPRAVWSFDHGLMLLGEDLPVFGGDGTVKVHFRYVPGIDPFWLRERLPDGEMVDWPALEVEYRRM